MNKKMKIALMALAALGALAGDAALTWRLAAMRANRAGSAPAYSPATNDPMARFRLEREQLRAREEAQLNDIIHDPGGDEAIGARAREQLLSLLDRSEKELALEGILQSRGFEDALVSLSDASANVLLRRESLTSAETAVILELVMRETGLTGGNVKIIPVK